MTLRARRLLRLLVILVVLGAIIGIVLQRSSYALRMWYPLPYPSEVSKFSEREGLPASLVAAMIYEESRFDPEAKSDKGAVGLMQVMPATAKWMYESQGIDEGDLIDPAHNVEVGTGYISYLLERYGDYRLALAAYNAGQSTLDGWLKEKGLTPKEVALHSPMKLPATDPQEGDFFDTIPFIETREFVRRVAESRVVYQRAYGLD